MSKKEKQVRGIFIVRGCLWVVALAATIHWIYWSFELYNMGILDVHEYAAHFRPIFGTDLLISIGSICVCLILRKISDTIKKTMKHAE